MFQLFFYNEMKNLMKQYYMDKKLKITNIIVKDYFCFLPVF